MGWVDEKEEMECDWVYNKKSEVAEGEGDFFLLFFLFVFFNDPAATAIYTE